MLYGIVSRDIVSHDIVSHAVDIEEVNPTACDTSREGWISCLLLLQRRLGRILYWEGGEGVSYNGF